MIENDSLRVHWLGSIFSWRVRFIVFPIRVLLVVVYRRFLQSLPILLLEAQLPDQKRTYPKQERSTYSAYYPCYSSNGDTSTSAAWRGISGLLSVWSCSSALILATSASCRRVGYWVVLWGRVWLIVCTSACILGCLTCRCVRRRSHNGCSGSSNVCTDWIWTELISQCDTERIGSSSCEVCAWYTWSGLWVSTTIVLLASGTLPCWVVIVLIVSA